MKKSCAIYRGAQIQKSIYNIFWTQTTLKFLGKIHSNYSSAPLDEWIVKF